MQLSNSTPIRLWQAVLRIPSLSAPRFLWQAELAEDWAKCHSLLIATSELAAWTHASDGVSTCEVLEHPDGTMVGINRWQNEMFEVDREAQVVCRLNLRTLATKITDALGGRVDYNSPSFEAKVHRIGRLPPRLGSTPLYLCVHSGDESLLEAAVALASSTHVVLLVPTLRRTSIQLDSLFDRFKTVVVPLDELIIESNGSWTCNPMMLEELRQRLGLGETADVNTFRLEGDRYVIRFGGKGFSLSDSVGLWYLREFISHPNTTMNPIDLEEARTGVTGRSSNSSTGEAFDAEARRQYAQQLTELEEDIIEATEFNDLGRLEQLQDQRQQILDYLSKAMGKGGKARVATDTTRARKNIRQQVSRDIDRIKKYCPALAEHFRLAFQSDAMCYHPREDPRWQL